MSTDRRPRSAGPTRVAASAIVLAVVAACAPAAPSATPEGSGSPTSEPSPTTAPTTGAIAHPTGAADVLLRVESGGGFVPIDFFATAAPSFTLYGDGTVVFKDPMATPPGPAGNVNRLAPFMTIRLDEEGIQAMLADAIGPGGLGTAVGPYTGQGADLPTTSFTITADGRTKVVSVTPLSPDMHPRDTAIVTALAGLAERLGGFAGVVAGEQVYVPPAYRGVVRSVDQPVGPVVAWPWAGVAPSDFVAGQNTFLLLRTMTPVEAAALGIPSIEGGFENLTLQRDGKLYTFALRPLLPDETK